VRLSGEENRSFVHNLVASSVPRVQQARCQVCTLLHGFLGLGCCMQEWTEPLGGASICWNTLQRSGRPLSGYLRNVMREVVM
jgi:hypothetical protein